MHMSIAIPGMSLYPGGVEHWWKDITTEQIVEIAQRCDDLGYDSLVVPEHIVMHHSRVPHMGPRWVHSLSATGFLLGATKNLKVFCIVVVPYHPPLELAKALSTLDWVSGGRLIPMLIVGEQEWEFDLIGVPFNDRGLIMNEYMDAMIELWTADEPKFDGQFVKFDEISFDPKPVHDPFPVWMGGRTKIAMRRIGRQADGWMNSQIPRALIPEFLDRAREQPEFQQRPRPLGVHSFMWEGKRDPVTHQILEQPKIIAKKDAILEQLHQLAAVGVTATGAEGALGGGAYQNAHPDAPPPITSCEQFIERLEWFAEDVLPEAKLIEPVGAGVAG